MSDHHSSTSCGVTRVCPDGARYVEHQLTLPPKRAVIACEGACIKGEVARTAANILAYQLHREDAVRICLGDASTGNSGMLELVKRAPEVLAVEGCPLCCGLAVLRMRQPEVKATIIDVSKLYYFDRETNFEIFDLPREVIDEFANSVAQQISNRCFAKQKEEASNGMC